MRSHGLAAEWLTPSEARRARAGPRPRRAGRDPRAARGGGRPEGDDRRARPRRSRPPAGSSRSRRSTGAILEGERLVGVRTADGAERRAGAVVLAAGSWSAAEWLPAEARPPVRPVKGQILTLAGSPAHPVCERIVGSERCYSVPRADGRLIVGATVEELGFDTRVTAGGIHELLREAYRTLPEIAELELVEAIAGLRPPRRTTCR